MMLEINNRDGLLCLPAFGTRREADSGRKAWAWSGLDALTPIGKVIVTMGLHVYLGGSVYDPACHCGHLPPGMAVPQP